MEFILNSISSDEIVRRFYEENVKGAEVVYKKNQLDKAHFLLMFEARYDINLEVNKRKLIGGLNLMKNLNDYEGDTIVCHTLKNGDNEVSLFSDPGDKYLFGFLLVRDGKVYGEPL